MNVVVDMVVNADADVVDTWRCRIVSVSVSDRVYVHDHDHDHDHVHAVSKMFCGPT